MADPRWLFADLDGTLAESLGVAFSTYQHFAELAGFGATGDEFDELNGPSLPEIVAILRERHRITADQDELEATYRRLWSTGLANVIAKAGAHEVLREAARRSMQVAVVTSGSATYARDFLKRSKLGEHVALLVSGEEVPRSKPDPSIYRLALERAGCSAPDVMAIEDSINGVASASAALIFTVGLSDGGPYTATVEQLMRAGASRVVDHLPRVFGDQRS